MYDFNIIKKTFENQMHQEVCSVEQFENVTNNSVFKIKTESQSYIFKVYSSGWPENGKLLFVTRKLDEYKIPHAKIYVFNREDKNFRNGYLIEECLTGITADRLQLTYDETIKLFEKLAALVTQIHQVELTGYGYIGDGIADYSTFSEFMKDVLNDSSDNLISHGFIGAKDLAEVNKKLYERFKRCDILPSVLCHGDLSTKNILINSNDITLIDWDDAQSLCWVADIARLTFWMRMHFDESFAAVLRKAFLDSYKTKHDKNIFNEIEDTLHVWYALDYLTFFTEGPICDKVQTLLQDSRNRCEI